jgi:hypothetical protein
MAAPKTSPLVLAIALLTAGCATSGAVPDATVAVIESSATIVDTIDERNVRDDGPGAANARFEIPPGRHTVEVSLQADRPASEGTNAKTIAVCFGALAGHSYLTRPVFEQQRWRPEIVDEASGVAVQKACAPPAPAIAVVAPTATPAAFAPATPTTIAPAPTATVSTVPEPSAAPQSLPVPLPPRLPHDTDLPGTGLSAGVGFFFGGQSLYDVHFTNAPDRSLSAGRGVLLSLGGLWTPLWVDDKIGFGVGARLGWKYDSIEAINGTASLTRFPVSASAHGLIRLDDRWFVLVSGGVEKEVGGHVSGNGFAAGINTELSSTLGLTGEAGLYVRMDHVAVGGGLRYSTLHDWFQGIKVNASSVGIVGCGQYSF